MQRENVNKLIEYLKEARLKSWTIDVVELSERFDVSVTLVKYAVNDYYFPIK